MLQLIFLEQILLPAFDPQQTTGENKNPTPDVLKVECATLEMTGEHLAPDFFHEEATEWPTGS
jgi:hypothetical protein